MQKIKIICLYLILLAVIVLTVIESQPRIKQIMQNYNEFKIKKETVEATSQPKNRILKDEDGVQDEIESTKEMYAAPKDIMGEDSAFNTLFEGVLAKANKVGVKVHSVDYEFISPTSKSKLQLNNKFSVCNLNMQLVANYVTFERFLQELYSYPYLVKINSMNVTPYQKDKRILLINLGLKLYVKNT